MMAQTLGPCHPLRPLDGVQGSLFSTWLNVGSCRLLRAEVGRAEATYRNAPHPVGLSPWQHFPAASSGCGTPSLFPSLIGPHQAPATTLKRHGRYHGREVFCALATGQAWVSLPWSPRLMR